MDDMLKANLIVRGELINFGKSTFNKISSIYRFTNENISSYFHHLTNKKNILSDVEETFQNILIPFGYVEILKEDVKLLVLGR